MSRDPDCPRLGVVVVTFNAADVILDCLQSLLAAPYVTLHVVVVDNASTDETVGHIRRWAGGERHVPPGNLPFPLLPLESAIPLRDPDDPGAGLTIIEAGVNGGFAAGVNIGLAHLAADLRLDRFWVLNPDSVVPPETPALLAGWRAPESGFSLLGGRVRYLEPPYRIQSDGGWVNPRTGVTGNLHLGRLPEDVEAPRVEEMDYISGACMVASREFYEQAGPLPEDYFLYYEEVDWAGRRGSLPLAYLPEAVIYHRVGSAIGSPTVTRIASPFSLYFLYRSRMRFMRRRHPALLPVAYGYAMAKGMQILLQGYRSEAASLFRAVHGLSPPAMVRTRLSPEAARRAFGA